MISSMRLKSNLVAPGILKKFFSSAPSASVSTSHLIPKSKPRHFITLEDYSPSEIFALLEKARGFKKIVKNQPLSEAEKHLKNSLATSNLSGKTVAIMFNKRSTRTRIATESSVNFLGGSSMFLSSSDIQLGVNESLLDSSIVISSMVDGIVARVHSHNDILELAKYSTVPVINALSDDSHPTQILADLLTMYEIFSKPSQSIKDALQGLNVSWVGDSNNMLYEFLTAFPKCGINLSAATPKKYPVPQKFIDLGSSGPGTLKLGDSPTDAISNSNVIITDTWVSMGQESEKAQRLLDFKGYQINDSLINAAGPAENYVFMHCLPRKPEEVSDSVFYGDRSFVFQEAENRKYTIMAVVHSLLIENGKL
ncbi:hypothetical protein BB560_003821 [Smittium megazygosporum]|uniref:ornithine carbamoyltransferase n=1 Tax=Smittium megazygosporum TaxID=133381 RepID=A0A2T9ZAZ4_9FUNG|nr:hypothetical protein BB560_003821 [Smittium megazygosporum]